MKLWLDDTRSPPDEGWFWAKDVEEAKAFLLSHRCEEQSLDHDLGPGKSDGHTLIIWEHDHALVPLFTNCHSWNRVGSERMKRFLLQHRYHAKAEADPRPPQ